MPDLIGHQDDGDDDDLELDLDEDELFNTANYREQRLEELKREYVLSIHLLPFQK
jgi:hypothetical protein